MTESAGLRRHHEALGFRRRGDIAGDNPPPFNATFGPRWQASLYEAGEPVNRIEERP